MCSASTAVARTSLRTENPKRQTALALQGLAWKTPTMAIARYSRSGSSKPTRSVPACEALLEPSGYHAIPLAAGLKKAKTTPPLEQPLLTPRQPEATVLELDEKVVSRLRRQWSFVRHKGRKRSHMACRM